MYRIAFVLLALVAASANGGVMKPSRVPALDGRIVGGEDTSIENFPYQVSVRILGSHICGGAIYNSRVIVTAAHCIFSFISLSSYRVQYGSTVADGTNNVISVERLVGHENYDPDNSSNDIALIFLSSDIPFSATAQPIPLATEAPATGTSAVVSGWGALYKGGPVSSILQKVDVNIVGRSECQAQYVEYNNITEDMLCAGVENGGKDACQGDSGGPLVANGELVGVVSFGMGCGEPDFAGVYSNVAHLRDWIETNINNM